VDILGEDLLTGTIRTVMPNIFPGLQPEDINDVYVFSANGNASNHCSYFLKKQDYILFNFIGRLMF
jgi:hypothetical protein